MNDDSLARRVLDAVVGPPDPERDRALEADLSGRPRLLHEYRLLRDAWEDLGRLPAGEAPPGARQRAERAVAGGMVGAHGRGQPGHQRRRWPLRAAAAVALFAAGAATGYGARPVEPPFPSSAAPAEVAEGPRYAVFMHPPRNPRTGEPATEVMRQWAADLWSGERLVWAERLYPGSALWVGMRPPGVDSLPPPDGMFIVRAGNRQEVEDLVRDSPYLAWGGVVQVLPTSEEGTR